MFFSTKIGVVQMQTTEIKYVQEILLNNHEGKWKDLNHWLSPCIQETDFINYIRTQTIQPGEPQ